MLYLNSIRKALKKYLTKFKATLIWQTKPKSLLNIVSFLVHFYTIGYMKHDPFISRFMSYLSLFTFFMIFLVISDNLLQLFIG